MVKAKLTDEEKERDFNNWLNSPESEAINRFCTEMLKKKLELGLCDISDDFTLFLNMLFEMVQELKVPGRKAKCKLLNLILFLKAYEQQYVRTMFFVKEETGKVPIDGTTY